MSTTIPTPADVVVLHDDTALARATMRRVSMRILPFLLVLFVCNYVDRANIGIAALQMNGDLGLSASAYGFGAGIFFVGYALFEVPSNLALARFGARRWIARIVITWGLVAAALAFVRTGTQFAALRFLLGAAEAGFFPGIIYYLSLWYPASLRARSYSRFIVAVPIAALVGNPLGGWLLGFDRVLGLRGWQWLFLLEGIASVGLGLATLRLLTDRPADARWLSAGQRDWLAARIRRDEDASAAPRGTEHGAPLRALAQPTVLLAAVMYFLPAVGFWGYLYWSPLVVRDALHASPVATGLITGAMGCAAALAILAVGASSDRTGDRWRHMIGSLSVMGLGYLGAALLPWPAARVASLALVLIGDQTFVVVFWCLPSTILRGSAAAAAIAFINSFGNLGGLVGPYLIGRFKDATGGTTAAFLLLAVPSLVAAALCLVLRRRFRTSAAER
ncbi:major facilitator superfamily MFS_1 [Gemmatirosa kalamazoonensis]|uniref:Major facilitator superfamily MFS_1 n=1 Tax=Gemmatirosa kalamazoonensis TaxID=861299 RepID=W0RIC8_9BACT|nr:MFS transporter [Gemmatirosa kalamazoonensis]AHG89163.1 major facilitator superfamily MFS_1 [Gemmatirosa kalamazoonensis]